MIFYIRFVKRVVALPCLMSSASTKSKHQRARPLGADPDAAEADTADITAAASMSSAHASECLLLRLIHGLYEDCEGGVQRYPTPPPSLSVVLFHPPLSARLILWQLAIHEVSCIL